MESHEAKEVRYKIHQHQDDPVIFSGCEALIASNRRKQSVGQQPHKRADRLLTQDEIDRLLSWG